SGHETLVNVIRRKSEALQKRAEDKPASNYGKNIEDATHPCGLQIDNLKKNVHSSTRKVSETVVTAFRTKSEALQKRAADKPIGVSGDHVVSIPTDDDDLFTTINTPFLAEVDRSAEEKIKSALREKNLASASTSRGPKKEPHPKWGFSLDGSQPSFSAITHDLPPTPPEYVARPPPHKS
ncbi:Unknown protein, partial [Striga hermonthica]